MPRQLYFDPWSDDRTTMPYDSDFALPEILEEYEVAPKYPPRAARRVATLPASYGAPAAWSSGVYSPQPQPLRQPGSAATRPGPHLRVVAPQARATLRAPVARPAPVAPHAPAARPAHVTRTTRRMSAVQPVRAVSPMATYVRDEEENPFASRGMTLGGWFLTTAAAAGIFGALLFGRVLMEASKAATAPAPTPLTATEALAGTTPTSPDPAPVAPPTGAVASAPLTASAIASPPIAAAKERASERRAKHSRRRSSTRDSSADESEPRAETSSRPEKTRSAAVSRREERAAKSERRVSSAPARSTEDDESDSKASNGTPGLLRINSRPWSQVFIDGKLIGNTPQFGISLPAGKHSVRLVNAEFGMSKVFTLKLGAGESVTRVEMLSE